MGEGVQPGTETGAETVEKHPEGPSHIVALGASAGGLDALERFFRNAPADQGLAYVVVVHLSPDFKSVMQELLGKHTPMPAHSVKDGDELQPNHIYVIPPAKNIVAENGHLRLIDQHRGSHGINLPIDIFFESISELYHERVIGVILSGTGTDGTRGMRAIKGHGGVSLVQDPSSAKFDGMPRSIIDAGLADYVLRPEEIADRVRDIASRPLPRLTIQDDAEPSEAPDLSRVLAQVRHVCGLDLSYYKRSTLARRVERRMKLRSADDIGAYVELLEREPTETEALKQDLLIGVTRFFRDRDAWEHLEQMVVPTLLKNQDSEPLRVWVPACSTGEEVYSLAVSLAVAYERHDQPLRAKIFGTDVDTQAIEYAGRGIYPTSIAADVPQDRLAKYFQNTEHGYRINQSIRERVIFAPHNVVKDAPLTRMDMVSCRNFLIYLEPALQREVLACLHFSVKPRGILMLGAAESVGDLADTLEPVDRKWKIYRKQRNTPLPELRRRAPLNEYTARTNEATDTRDTLPSATEAASIQALDVFAELRQCVCLLISPARQLLRVYGDAAGVLRPPRGDVRNEVVDTIAEPLKIPLTTAMHRMLQKSEQKVSYGDIDLGGTTESRRVNLEVRALPMRGADDLMLAIIEPSRDRPVVRPDPAVFDDDAQQQIHDLESELQRTRENLQATIEELATTNEEQQATNEELTASNEELQSTNEELQSVNEELFTVNGEYQSKIQELTDLTNDTENLLRSTEIGVIYLDKDLRIRKFTPAVTRVIDLIPADVGRPLSGFTYKFESAPFIDDIREAANEGRYCAREVPHRDGETWFLKRVQPYRTETGAIDGVVITFVDITDLKQTQQQLANQKELLNAIASNAPVLLLAQNSDGEVQWCNRAFENLLGWSYEDVAGEDLLTKLFPDPATRRIALEGHSPAEGPVVWHDLRATCQDGEKVDLAWANVLLSDGRHICVGQDVTQRRRDERRQALMVRELDHRVKNNLNTVLAVAKETARLTTDIETFNRAFEGRVRSMAIAHEMLASTRWDGADLHEMARRVLEPYGLSTGRRISISGAQAKLNRDLAPTLCMVLHELTTNAAKYGALSVPEGRVTLSWVLESPEENQMRLRIEWQESDGPPVPTVTHRGYGSQFVTEAVEYGLDGKADLRFDKEGVKCTIVLPYRQRPTGATAEAESAWETAI
jgi:PAS domain S-box-containing protein